ncbi:MAG: hypothetical protein JO333_13145 [Verrucomicrobia bacterium]|nr:hypothetical protein [Verrucomicrobiota bacterium]
MRQKNVRGISPLPALQFVGLVFVISSQAVAKDIKEALQREGHIPSDLEDRHLVAMSEVFKNNERLARTFVPL